MNKVTPQFKTAIQTYLEQRALNDVLFTASFHKPNKSIDNCITYILNTVQKSGCKGYADDEIYSMAVHYYDEDNIEVGKSINCNVVVNHTVELTAEEKEEARQNAIKQVLNNEVERMTKKTVRKSPTNQPETANQLNLFEV
jgi:hypothetical protein